MIHTYYRCSDCKEVFAEPEEGHYHERVEYWGCVTNERFTIDLCPHCFCEDIYECEVIEEETDEG